MDAAVKKKLVTADPTMRDSSYAKLVETMISSDFDDLTLLQKEMVVYLL